MFKKRRRKAEDYNFNQEYQQGPFCDEAYVEEPEYQDCPPTRQFVPLKQQVQDYTHQLENREFYDPNESFDPNYHDEHYNDYYGQYDNQQNQEYPQYQEYYDTTAVNQEEYYDQYNDDYIEYQDDYIDEDIEKELSREAWKTANTLFNLISTIVGVFAVFLLMAILLSLINWLKMDFRNTFRYISLF
ncbi:MAG: hypothetical protein GYA87_01840 [Christensenellaceae bacterium]|nr:hypothetical protein [Christensenellaceae bacterium]